MAEGMAGRLLCFAPPQIHRANQLGIIATASGNCTAAMIITYIPVIVFQYCLAAAKVSWPISDCNWLPMRTG